jgi:hypothetical protein
MHLGSFDLIVKELERYENPVIPWNNSGISGMEPWMS